VRNVSEELQDSIRGTSGHACPSLAVMLLSLLVESRNFNFLNARLSWTYSKISEKSDKLIIYRIKLRGVTLSHFYLDLDRRDAMNHIRGKRHGFKSLPRYAEVRMYHRVSTKAVGSNFSTTRSVRDVEHCIGVSDCISTRDSRRTVSLCDGTRTLILDKSIRQPISI